MSKLHTVLLIFLCLTLAACGSKPHKTRPYFDGAPDRAVDISKIPEPKPKFEPISRYGNKNPYQVFGKSYHLLPQRAGYLQRGMASWYGTKFHGLLTSNREIYDMYAFTAAHKTLPLPTYAQVTNLENGRSIVVRINDRGPFVGDRIIDLSYVAAIKLDMHRQGTARVEVKSITPGESANTPQTPSNPSRIPPANAQAARSAVAQTSAQAARSAVAQADASPSAGVGDKPFLVQCGAFSDKNNAQAHVLRLSEAGFSDARVLDRQDGWYRVVFGPLAQRADLDALRMPLREADCELPKAIEPVIAP